MNKCGNLEIISCQHSTTTWFLVVILVLVVIVVVVVVVFVVANDFTISAVFTVLPVYATVFCN